MIRTFCIFALLMTATTAVAQPELSKRPNVIFILADDLGTIDAHCYGAQDLSTPAIDSLAAGGLRFTSFYAASAVCSPSRAAILTGRMPRRAGLEGNAAPPPLRHSGDRGSRGLPADEITLAEVFAGAGYRTAHIGKWHLGHADGMQPTAQGFDYSFGHLGGCIDNYSHFNYWGGPNRHDLWLNGEPFHAPGRFFGDLMVEQTETFIDQGAAEEPFFIYFAINMPHYPYQGRPYWLKHYEDFPYPRNLYAAFVSTMDEVIGDVLSGLDKRGLAENTIVVFQSDHGHSTEERAHHGGGDNGIYRGAKFSLFEGGIRVPAIIRWPAGLPAGEVRDQPAHGCDWLPTLAALCGIEPPAVTLDGRDLSAVLRSAGVPSPHDRLIWTMGDQWAVRQGDWKLIHRPNPTGDGPSLTDRDREWFLVNLAQDPGEADNRVLEQAERAEALHDLYRQWNDSLNR